MPSRAKTTSGAVPPEDDHPDPTFTSLPLILREQIDTVFSNHAAGLKLNLNESADREPPRKKRKLESSAFSTAEPKDDASGGFLVDDAPGGFLIDDTPGGFLLDDSDDHAQGGFLVEDGVTSRLEEDDGSEVDTARDNTHISLKQIPAALQELDLPPADPDILEVFRNAASGWEFVDSRPNRPTTHAEGDEDDDDTDAHALVSRKDFRSVCAVLMEGREVESMDEQTDARSSDKAMPLSGEEDAFGGELSDLSDDTESFGGSGSDDEYNAAPRPSKKVKGKRPVPNEARASGRRTKRTIQASRESSSISPRPLTSRQKKDCAETFALFFQDIGGSQKGQKRIGVKDITRVAHVLKEKITAEEILEMLQMFSTSPDLSVGLADFERMMVTARLV